MSVCRYLWELAQSRPLNPRLCRPESATTSSYSSTTILIDSLHGAELKLQTPQPAGVAIKFDKPWEGNVSAYVTGSRDGEKFRMYYRGASAPDYIRKSALKTGEVITAKHADVTSYAESIDGITWTKPSLGIEEFQGSRDNNIILIGGETSENFGPFLDGNPQAPASERYKAVGGESKGLFALQIRRWDSLAEYDGEADNYGRHFRLAECHFLG